MSACKRFFFYPSEQAPANGMNSNFKLTHLSQVAEERGFFFSWFRKRSLLILYLTSKPPKINQILIIS